MTPVQHLLPALVLGLAAWGAQAQPAEPVQPGADLDGLLALARANNPGYGAQRLQAQAAAERGTAAGALPDPRLRAELMDVTRGGQQNPTLLPGRTGSTRYTLMQELPWFGKRALRREVAELEAAAETGQVHGSWAELAARIKSTQARRHELARSEQIRREQLDLLRQLEQVAQARYAAGLAAQQDVIRAQLEQTALRAELIGLQAEQLRLQARMNALLGRPAQAPLAQAQPLPPLPDAARLAPNVLLERARMRNPRLASEAARQRQAEKARDLTLRNRYPDVTVGIAPNQFGRAVRQWDLMVEMSLPLQQSSRRAQEREAQHQVEAARLRQEAAANELTAELTETLAALDAARQTEALAASALAPQAELALKSALAGYESGRVDFAAVLDAQRQLRLARLGRIQAEAEGQSRLAEIERMLGEAL